MSDGPSDCAHAAETKAERLIAEHWPKLKRINYHTTAPRYGTVVYLYEEWLTHIVEVIVNRQVKERWVCEPFSEPVRRKLSQDDWPVGYYRENHLPRRKQ